MVPSKVPDGTNIVVEDGVSDGKFERKEKDRVGRCDRGNDALEAASQGEVPCSDEAC